MKVLDVKHPTSPPLDLISEVGAETKWWHSAVDRLRHGAQ